MLLRSVLILLLLLPLPAAAGEVRVFAAASLSDAIREIGDLYVESRPGISIVGNFSGSGTLAKQIVNGAPADVFLSADPLWMDYLAAEGYVEPENILVFARNALVFAGAPDRRIASMSDLPGLRRIAIGSPGSVPAGRYAEAALRSEGLYDALREAGKLVIAKDVRQALMYADRGEVDGAFVYRTDALLSPRVRIHFEPPSESYPPVIYPMALTASGAEKSEAVDFYRFLRSPEARAVLDRYGFLAGSGS
jgi:molybdate transport system substrate-binding protein